MLPDPEPVDCLWCSDGAPDTLRLAGAGLIDDVYSVWLAEQADGGGRGIIIQRGDPREEDESHIVSFEPAHQVIGAGLRDWSLAGTELGLQFIREVADQVDGEGWLRFRIAVQAAAQRELRAGLIKILSGQAGDS